MGTMDSEISIQPGYLMVRRPPNYEVSISDEPTELKRISAACKAADCRKVLILGSNTEVRLSTLDVYDLGKEIAKLGLKIAVVEHHDASNDDVEFLETVAINRGGSLSFFSNEQDARDWLKVD